jgi:probable HAF family extracellular repeat protein
MRKTQGVGRRLCELEVLENRQCPSSYAISELFVSDNGQGKDSVGLNELGQVIGGQSARGFDTGFSLGSLGGTGGSTGLNSLNDSGAAVGESRLPDGDGHAFVNTPAGAVYDLGTVDGGPGVSSEAYAINDEGQVVGISDNFDGSETHAFFYSDGTMHDLGTFGGTFSQAFAINNIGQVVGNADQPFVPGQRGITDAFLSNNGGALVDLGTLPGFGPDSTAFDINDRGQIAGESESANPIKREAFLYDPDTGMHDLGTLGVGSYALGINDQGQVVGYNELQGGSSAAFLDTGGVMTDLNTLLPPNADWVLIRALDINDKGQILTIGYKPDDGVPGHLYKVVLLSPVPDPGSFGVANLAKVLMVDPTAQSAITSTPFADGHPTVAGDGVKSEDDVATIGTTDVAEGKAQLVDTGQFNTGEEWRLTATAQAQGGIAGAGDPWASDVYSVKSTGTASFYDSILVTSSDPNLPFGTQVPLYLVVRDAGVNSSGAPDDSFLVGARVYHADGSVDDVGLSADTASRDDHAFDSEGKTGSSKQDFVLSLGTAAVGETIELAPWLEAIAESGGIHSAMSLDRTEAHATFHVATSAVGVTLTSASGWTNTSDEDGDGLLDPWEAGLPYDGDYTDGSATDPDFTLQAVNGEAGPNPFRHDIFVEADAMSSRAPAAGTLQPVVVAFANAPVANVPNADGTASPTGITLHIELDELNLPLVAWTSAKPFDDFDALKKVHFSTPAERNPLNGNPAAVLGAKRMAYRYCIFADSRTVDGASGQGEIGGNDFMINLDAGFIQTAQQTAIDFPGFTAAEELADMQAGTFMHELGHTLGLRHGGGDDTNGKPNYISVMNYSRQFNDSGPASGIPGIVEGNIIRLSRVLDYSRQVLDTLDETKLNESVGVNGPAGVLVEYGDDAGNNHIGPANGPINWNGDTNADGSARIGDAGNPVASDVDYSPAIGGTSKNPSPGEKLKGFDDWSNLIYGFRNLPTYKDGVHDSGLGADADVEATAEDYRLAVIGNPSILVTTTQDLVTTSGGGTTSFNVSLRTRPTANVTIALSSDNPEAGRVSPAQLVFTPDDWFAAQVVTITGAPGGLGAYHIVTAPAVSADLNYSGMDAPDALVNNQKGAGPPVVAPHVARVSWVQHGGKPTVLILAFDEALNPSRARSKAEYHVTSRDGKHVIPIVSVAYDSKAHTVKLRLARRLSTRKTFLLQIKGKPPAGLEDENGTFLDGSGAGRPGTDYKSVIDASLRNPVPQVARATWLNARPATTSR